MRPNYRVFACLMGAAVVGASLSACSSPASTGSTASAGSAASSPSGNSINIMALATFYSPSVSFPDSEAGFVAEADAINAAGGINGHKLNLTTCDDQFDPNTAENCAREAVSDHDVAVLTSFSTYPEQVIPIIAAAGIPLLYGQVDATLQGTSPDSFPLNAGSAAYFDLGLVAVKDGCTKVGAVVAANPATEYGETWLEQGVKQAGGTVVQSSAGVTQADFLAPVANLVSEKVGCIVPVTAPNQGVEIAQATKQQAPQMPIFAVSEEYGTSQLQSLGSQGDGIVLVGQNYRVTDTSQAVVKQIEADFKQYQPSIPLTDVEGLQAWAAVDAFSQLAASIKGSITAATVAAAAKTFIPKVGIYGTPGAGAPLSKELPQVRNWSYLVWTVKNGIAVLNSPDFTSPSAVS